MKNKFDTIQGVKLLSDAGNTYNQTQLTPSEILAQRNELAECLKETLKEFKYTLANHCDILRISHDTILQNSQVIKAQSL